MFRIRSLGSSTSQLSSSSRKHVLFAIGTATSRQPFSTTTIKMTSISDAIIKDHRELEKYYNEVINSNDHDHQERFGNQFVWELARHSVGEELVVYPAIEKHLGEKGKHIAEEDRKEHHKVKVMLKDFQSLKPDDANFVPMIKEIWTVLSHHIRDEEKDDLPALEGVLRASSGKSEALATSFGRTKAFVPSRSHPSAGEHPPFETAVGLLFAPIDHVADLFRKFPDKTISPNPSTK